MVETTSRMLNCTVVTPERAVLDETADFVALPMYDGELGVLPGRAALIGRLGYGELRVRSGARIERYYIDGGFAQVRSNTVTVLTPRAVRASEIDVAAAEQNLQAARTAALVPDDPGAQARNQERARAQLRIARHRVGHD